MRAVTASRDIRLLVSDVDGTLVTDGKVLTDGAIAAVRALHDAGVAFAVTSGRPPRGMKMLVEPLAISCPIAGFNGGVYVQPDMTVIESYGLDPAAAEDTVRLLDGQGLDAWVYNDMEWLVRDAAAPYVEHEAMTVGFGPRIVRSFSDRDLSHTAKIVGVSPDYDRVSECETLVRGALGDEASVARSQRYYLDVTHARANKGTVVATLSDMLGIPTGQIATIGDMPTDVPMFARSGYSIAMGNASDAVKAQSTVVTDSNENDGFAKAVERYLLPHGLGGD